MFKLRFTIVLLSVFCFKLLPAQVYQTIKSNRIGYFENQSGNIKCIRIDSVNYHEDSIFYPFSNIQQIDYDCFTPYGASWLGNKVIVQNNGYNLFFNQLQDTIKIKTNALLGESWIAYQLEDSTTVIAEVIEHDTLVFMGQLDSVKRFGFQVYDKTLTPISHNLNNESILLSKNYGMLKTFNFYLFPDYESDFFDYEQFQTYELIGLSNPSIGVQNLTWFEVHDFQVGDELHIEYETSSWGDGNDYSESIKTIYKYLGRTDYSDYINYNVEMKSSKHRIWSDSSAFEYIHDTIESIINQNTTFNHLPGEPIISNNEAYSYSMTKLTKTEPSIYERIWGSNNSCWSNCCADGCFPSYNYIKGLGGPYYRCDNAFSLGGTENSLVYYKKGLETWGAPLIITEISNTDIESSLEIFPNPAIENIYIRSQFSNLPLAFELVDLKGQIVMIEKVDTELYLINIAEIAHGIYIYRLKNNKGIINFGKLIITSR